MLVQVLAESIVNNRWIPHKPTEKQAEFLMLPDLEALYGGAAGGGKSDALLMGGLQFVDIPGYNAIIFRRTHRDHLLPEGLIPRSFEWLGETNAEWNGADYKWRFPSGATLTFGYLDTEKDKYRYQSAAFQYIAWDELTQFFESQYRYLMSRLRRLKGYQIPLRVRSATNPGGIGHDWVKQRFLVEGPKEGRVFIPALLEDNPFLDRETYEKSLKLLDHVTYRQLRLGDWEIRGGAGKFKREWFEIVDEYPKDVRKVRYWDLAATLPKEGVDPDWTAGALVGEKAGIYYILDIVRRRDTPQRIEVLIKTTADLDGPAVSIYMEEEPGASGASMIDYYARNVLKGYPFRGHKTITDKEIRANPVSAATEGGNVKVLRKPWLNDFFEEFEIFPQGSHDDQVDAVSGAFAVLRGRPSEKAFMFGG